MLTWKDILIAAVVLFLIDIPWLMITNTYATEMFVKIQGSPIKLVWWSAAVVYLALAYLILQLKTPQQAFSIGAATYAVYDFTNLATLKNYDPRFAVADSIWGGILFAIARSVLNSLGM